MTVSAKSLQKQLIAAIAMVLVAAIALGSSTYAWFASNNTVTAKGMNINAQAEGNLLVISNSPTLGTSTTVNMSLTGSKLFPTHLTTAINGTPAMTGASSSWTHSFSTEFATAITDTSSSSETTLNLSVGNPSENIFGTTADEKQVADQYYDTTGKQYFLAGKLYIGLDDKNAASKCGAISLTDFAITSSSTLLSSARVALVNLSTYDKSSTTPTTVNALKGVIALDGSDKKKVTAIGDYKTADTLGTFDDTTNKIEINSANLEAGDYVEVGVYIYFDGRDTSCTSANYDANDISVSLTFTAAEAAA